jgi:hypothetical protein
LERLRFKRYATTGEFMSLNIAKKSTFTGMPENFDQMLKMAEMISKSDLAPKDYKGRPENTLIAIQMGIEVGLPPMSAIQNIAVINGRPSIWGDAALALVLASPVCEDVIEKELPDGYTCIAKRIGQEPRIVTFTIEEAKKAGLWGKAGPWTNYPKRMLQMRARGYALRDKFPDVLKGLSLAEEAMDIPPERDITPNATTQESASQMDKLKQTLKIQQEVKELVETIIQEEPQVNFDFSEELEKLKAIENIDSLIDSCKFLASIISDVEQRKLLEKTFKERKKILEDREQFKRELEG